MQHSDPDAGVNEIFEPHQSDIEDQISFYNFGHAPEDEHLTREEEVHLLPFDIDMAETPTPRSKRWQSLLCGS